MKLVRLLPLGFAVSALLSATALAQKVTYDFDRNEDFTRLKTYSIDDSVPSDRGEGMSTYDSPFVRERTNAAIAAQLDARGLRRDDSRPDVRVTSHRTFKSEYVHYPPVGWGWGYPFGWGLGWGWGHSYGWGYGYGSPGYTEEITVGTLMIDMQDAATGELIWRGVGVKEVHPTSKPEKRAKRVAREVAKIFERFPPDSGVFTTTDDDDVSVDR
jgi:uncharacterized protein DUF4136